MALDRPAIASRLNGLDTQSLLPVKTLATGVLTGIAAWRNWSGERARRLRAADLAANSVDAPPRRLVGARLGASPQP